VNVLILNYEYPPLGGGAGACAQAHAQGLLHYGHHITVITTWFEGQQEQETNENLSVIRLKSSRKYTHKSSISEKISWLKKAKLFLLDFCTKTKFDICLTHFTIPGGEVAYALKKKFGIPFVIISHGHDIPWFFPQQMFMYHLALYWYIKKISKQASAIVVLNNQLKKTATQFLGDTFAHKIHVIPNGCNTSFFKPDDEKTSDIFKIIFTGRLVAQKDPMTFMKAVNLFAKEGCNFVVEIIGDGPLKKTMLTYVHEKQLEKHVSFKGWVPKEDMLCAYQSAHVHVMTSVAEAMSVASLESLSAGLYLISTPAGINAQIINNDINGNIVPFNNPHALANTIKKYYVEKYLKKYKIPQNIIANFKEEYNWQNIVRKYNDLLLKIQK